MSPFDPNIDAAFREYADLELRCHRLLLEGKEDTPEIIEAEDRMTELWEKLDEMQRQSLSGMGSDLNWVRRKGEPPPNGRKKPEQIAPTERQAIQEAMESKDWHRLLHYLRMCAPDYPIATLATLRGRAYEGIGFPAYATIFFERAGQLEPTDDGLVGKALRSDAQTS
jgi:hypothetical protein